MIASIPSPGISEILIGPFHLRFYALAILVGIFLAIWITDRRYTARGGPREVTMDVAVWMVLFGIVGARLYHVITSPDAYFGENGDFLKIFRIWEGGLGIWGSVAAGALGGYIALHRRGLRFATFADAVAPGLLVAQAVGRLGNWFNQELFGKPTDLPWALQIDAAHMPRGFEPGTTFHPTFLYELLWCLAMAGVLVLLEKRFKLRGGQTILMYVILYTVGRLWIEALRIDSAHLVAGLRLNIWTSLIVMMAAVVVLMLRTRAVKADPARANIFLAEAADETSETDTHAETL